MPFLISHPLQQDSCAQNLQIRRVNLVGEDAVEKLETPFSGEGRVAGTATKLHATDEMHIVGDEKIPKIHLWSSCGDETPRCKSAINACKSKDYKATV